MSFLINGDDCEYCGEPMVSAYNVKCIDEKWYTCHKGCCNKMKVFVNGKLELISSGYPKTLSDTFGKDPDHFERIYLNESVKHDSNACYALAEYRLVLATEEYIKPHEEMRKLEDKYGVSRDDITKHWKCWDQYTNKGVQEALIKGGI